MDADTASTRGVRVPCPSCGTLVRAHARSCFNCRAEIPVPSPSADDSSDPAEAGAAVTTANRPEPMVHQPRWEDLRPLATPAMLVTIGMWTTVALSVLRLAVLWGAGTPETVQVALSLDGLASLAFLATGILFVVWQVRGARNARTLWGSDAKGPAWAWGWIVPLGSLFMPYLSVRGIWRAAHFDDPAWKARIPPDTFRWWWGLFLAYLIVSRFGAYVARDPYFSLETVLRVDAVVVALMAGAAGTGTGVVRSITRLYGDLIDRARTASVGD